MAPVSRLHNLRTGTALQRVPTVASIQTHGDGTEACLAEVAGDRARGAPKLQAQGREAGYKQHALAPHGKLNAISVAVGSFLDETAILFHCFVPYPVEQEQFFVVKVLLFSPLDN